MNTVKDTLKLNLARKWRVKTFDHIVDQDLPVRMLKNSLYLGHYFPVYLFSGQHGCGKTTLARIFAAALNCEQLSLFQENPKTVVLPCLTCQSCIALNEGRHPDFIEIDAASHTGVDNVRQIIDSSSLLPLMGRKKVYLIDEAHMLSKAAFNALLKVLEEPPCSTLFILATTDSQKILETVRSRCFQLFFQAVTTHALVQHLSLVCTQELIPFEQAALELIVRETEGSVRDALNMVEQARFSSARLTKQAVLQVLGHIDSERLIQLLQLVVLGKVQKVLELLHEVSIDSYNADFIWNRFIMLLRDLLLTKHNISPKHFVDYEPVLQKLAKNCSIQRLQHMLEVIYASEDVFLKTTAQHVFLEMMFVRLAQGTDDNEGGSSSPGVQVIESMPEEVNEQEDDDIEDDEDIEEDDARSYNSFNDSWQQFVKQVETLQDPLLNSIFVQGNFVSFDIVTQKLHVEFSKDFIFFKDWLINTEALWKPLLKNFFSESVIFDPQFTGRPHAVKAIESFPKNDERKTVNTLEVQSIPQKQNKQSFVPIDNKKNVYHRAPSNIHKNGGRALDVSDTSVWKITNLVLQHFPGTIIEVGNNS